MALIECVPNISEGIRTDVVADIVQDLRGIDGLHVLDVQSDPTHNRSVLTLAGTPEVLRTALPRLCELTMAAVDLRTHRGEHPRLGAVDVMPFIPLEGATMADCVALARLVGAELGARLALPVYLYEEAASSPARRNLEEIRRGEFEGLADKMRLPEWAPDFGPATPHPTAGATVVGARMPLIAYNINLATDRVDVARKIASTVRGSSGGLRYVKAMGLSLEGRPVVQVSMNLTNFEKTPMHRVFDMVQREAARYGVTVLESEIVGLVPQAALLLAAAHYLQLEGFSARQVLEHRLQQP